jgi:hypothetical protein
MSAAEKYGRVQDMPAEALTQAREAGQVIKDSGTTYNGGAKPNGQVAFAGASGKVAVKCGSSTSSNCGASVISGRRRPTDAVHRGQVYTDLLSHYRRNFAGGQ